MIRNFLLSLLALVGGQLFFVLTVSLGFVSGSFADANVSLDAWQVSGFGDWKKKSFKDKTRYKAGLENGVYFLSAKANNAASALFLDRKINIKKSPILNWRWRLQEFNGAKKHLSKGEDDFPARIYVVVRDGFFPWQTLAINYVWAEGEVGKAFWPNPFTAKAIMVPIAQGRDGAGEWRQEKVNIVADFKRLFDRDISAIDGVAIMTDADNFGGVSAADYGAIWLSAE
ncbi:MAG: hypothetical protein ACI89D_002371 [Bermanella sp.]